MNLFSLAYSGVYYFITIFLPIFSVIYYYCRPLIFSLLWPTVSDDVDKGLSAEKSLLFSPTSSQHHGGEIKGTVLEIGAGTGSNIKYYNAAIINKLYLNEPCERMHQKLLESAHKKFDLSNITILSGGAETLSSVPTASVDVVVCTLVLCSVNNQKHVLQEVLRVLKPMGRFFFMEHIAAKAGTKLRRKQNFWEPIWQCLPLDGCSLNCETDGTICQTTGFEKLGELKYFMDNNGPKIAAPTVSGVVVATKTRK